MGLASAAGPECDDVFVPLDPFAAGKLKELHLGELRDHLEFEEFETLGNPPVFGLYDSHKCSL